MIFSAIKDDTIRQTSEADVIRAWDQHTRAILGFPLKAQRHLATYRDQKIVGIRKMREQA